jgi:hypothetical protein
MEKIEDEILMGGWRCLCIGLLLQAVQNAEKDGKLMRFNGTKNLEGSGLDKELIYQRLQSREWLKGGRGLVTFEDCCEAMGINPDRARQMIKEWARVRKRVPEIKEIQGVW